MAICECHKKLIFWSGEKEYLEFLHFYCQIARKKLKHSTDLHYQSSDINKSPWENFRKFQKYSTQGIKKSENLPRPAMHFFFFLMYCFWSGIPQHTKIWYQYKGLKGEWFQSLAPQDLYFTVWQLTICKTTADLTMASHMKSSLWSLM